MCKIHAGTLESRGYSSEFSVGVCRPVPQILTQSAHHLNGIFGNNFSTNGTGRSAPAENGKEMNGTICEPFFNAAKVWVQTLCVLLSKRPLGYEKPLNGGKPWLFTSLQKADESA